MDSVKPRVYGYVRISSLKQLEGGNISIPLQTETIKKWVKENNFKLVEIKQEIVSGTLNSTDKPILNEILSKLKSGDILATCTVARFGRNFNDFTKTVELIHEKGAYFAAIKDGYDTRSSEGILHMGMLSKMAARQVEEIRELALEAAEYFRQNDRHNGRTPYGYKKRSPLPGSGIVEVPEEQAVLAYIKMLREFRDEDTGIKTSYRMIAGDLNNKKIPTPTKTGPWSHATVRCICKREKVRTKGRQEYELMYKLGKQPM